MAVAVTGNPFLDGLLERAPATASTPRRGQNYNYPLRRYLLPDGRVEWLQGDPHNRAYYEDKGYKLLSDVPGRNGQLSEVAQYEQVEYPKLLAEQREKALIINSIRRANDRDPTMNLPTEYDGWTLEQLKDELVGIKEQFGRDIRMYKPRHGPQTAEDRVLTGVETTEQTSLEEIERKRAARPPAGR
jgi:hypothetical protein